MIWESGTFTDSFSGCDGTDGLAWSCCSLSKLCGIAEGHCDNDDECSGHLSCGTKNCFAPFFSYYNCCYDPFTRK